jgi:hypothetical protein
MSATSYNGTRIWKRVQLVGQGGDQSVTGNLAIGGLLSLSSNNSVTANGTTQLTSAVLTNNINVVSTVPVNSGVTLPIAVSGIRVIVRNNSNNTLNIYPNIGASINSGAINAAVTLAGSASVEYFCSASAVSGVGGSWYTLNSTYA